MSILKEFEAAGYDPVLLGPDVASCRAVLRRLVDSIRVSQTADDKLKGAYFRMLLTHTCKGFTFDDRLNYLSRGHKQAYETVCEVMITPDIKADPNDTHEEKARKYNERQSRVMFAVSAKSTILRALKAGITLTPDMSKGQIETLIRQAKQVGKGPTDWYEWSMRQLNTLSKHAADMTPEQWDAVQSRMRELAGHYALAA